jgi:hypothetical protein
MRVMRVMRVMNYQLQFLHMSSLMPPSVMPSAMPSASRRGDAAMPAEDATLPLAMLHATAEEPECLSDEAFQSFDASSIDTEMTFDIESGDNDFLSLLYDDLRKQKSRKFTCPYPGCGKRFVRSSHLSTHVRVLHEKIKLFKCTECPKTFGTKPALNVHLMSHSGERPYRCKHPGCERRFRQKMHMLRHVRVHTGEKPFICHVCKRGFSQASSMRRHMKNRHAAMYSKI